jgi:DNA-directed RNA polymerase subunit RPC12/RpoP
MIRYSCPSCKQALSAQDHEAGTKLHCPRCNQRLQIPAPPAPKVAGTVLGKLEDQDNRTVLGKMEDHADPPDPSQPPPRRQPRQQVIRVEAPPPEDDEAADRDERPSRQKKKRDKWRCPHCDSDEPFRTRRTLTVLSWVLLVVFIWVFPFCLLALLITEDGEYCVDCGQKVGSRGTSFGLPG